MKQKLLIVFMLAMASLLLVPAAFAGKSTDTSVKCAFMTTNSYPEFTGLTNANRCKSMYNKAVDIGLWVPGYKNYQTMYTVYVSGNPVDVDFAMAGKTSLRSNARIVLFTQDFLNSVGYAG